MKYLCRESRRISSLQNLLCVTVIDSVFFTQMPKVLVEAHQFWFLLHVLYFSIQAKNTILAHPCLAVDQFVATFN
jgi:hypothetical protein